jgi:hypothetical protein
VSKTEVEVGSRRLVGRLCKQGSNGLRTDEYLSSVGISSDAEDICSLHSQMEPLVFRHVFSDICQLHIYSRSEG